MDAKVYELINDQINKELYSAYLYLSFADYYEEEGLSGYANYFEIQAQEERDHAMIFRNYLHENGKAVKLLAIDMPDKTFANFLEPLEAAMEHEKYVTSLINDIYAAALEAHDYRAQKFLGWFIDEQLEEEDNAETMVTPMKLFGDDGSLTALYKVDRIPTGDSQTFGNKIMTTLGLAASVYTLGMKDAAVWTVKKVAKIDGTAV